MQRMRKNAPLMAALTAHFLWVAMTAMCRRCLKTQKNSARVKIDLSTQPLRDFLDIGNGSYPRKFHVFAFSLSLARMLTLANASY
jgi:hypothetical protein